MPTRGNSVFLVTVTEGEYGDPEAMAVGKDEDAAKAWCDEHRKLSGADPVQWTTRPDLIEGKATGFNINQGSATRYKIQLIREVRNTTVFYYIEPLPFIEDAK